MNDNAEIRKDAPIYKQLSDEILRSIKTGKLPAGSRLPTVRELAEEKKDCIRLTPSTWAKRPVSEKVLESVMRLFSPIL